MSATDQLFVKSHVARDLLQNAGLFKTDKLVVWEYVANGLQYTNVGRIVIKDTQAWGLGPFFRRRGGEPGDFFQIVFDTKRKLASVHLGELLNDERDS